MEIQTEADLHRDYDMEKRTPLAKGGFGWVDLVLDRRTHLCSALKAQFKGTSRYRDWAIKREKIALESMDHPNIIKLKAVYEGDYIIYFLMELMQVQDLYVYSCKFNKGLPLENIQYFAAELVSALEHIRLKGFIHRDLKAKNVLISEEGHAKIADFGMARKISDSQGRLLLSKSDIQNTKAGTWIYTAPEVLKQSSVTFSTDLWGLAVIVSEMYTADWVCRKYPGESEDDWLKRVEAKDYKFKSDYPNPLVEGLIKSLTRIDPTQRLGAADINDLKNHALFNKFKFDLLHQTKPPKLPQKPLVINPYVPNAPVPRPATEAGYQPQNDDFFSTPPPRHPTDDTPTGVDATHYRSEPMASLLRHVRGVRGQRQPPGQAQAQGTSNLVRPKVERVGERVFPPLPPLPDQQAPPPLPSRTYRGQPAAPSDLPPPPIPRKPRAKSLGPSTPSPPPLPTRVPVGQGQDPVPPPRRKKRAPAPAPSTPSPPPVPMRKPDPVFRPRSQQIRERPAGLKERLRNKGRNDQDPDDEPVQLRPGAEERRMGRKGRPGAVCSENDLLQEGGLSDSMRRYEEEGEPDRDS